MNTMLHDKVKPYDHTGSKKEQVAGMFDNISGRYDLLNDLLSLGIHRRWRRKCVKLLANSQPKHILDVATGTADFAIALAALHPARISGIDISEGMLQLGREKVKKHQLEKIITLEYGDAETVATQDNAFDAIVAGFGVRNFSDLEKGLLNMKRMLRPGGTLLILEFSYPSNQLVRWLYDFYFGRITPLAGRLFSSDKRAYSYLTESVKAFPHNASFTALLDQLGFRKSRYLLLSAGIAAIYTAEK